MMLRTPLTLRRRILRALLLVGALLLLLPARAAAQPCTEEPCGPVDTLPPTIVISPGTGTYSAGNLGVNISWSDNTVLNHNSRLIMYGDSNVTSAFSYTWTSGAAAQSVGSVIVGPGSRTLTASICDQSSYGPHCRAVSVTYSGPTPPVRVTAETTALSLPGASLSAARFRVVNLGASPGQYTVEIGCPAGFSGCTASTSSLVLAAGDSAWVDAYFTTPASGGGAVTIRAYGGSATSTGSTSITTAPAPDPGHPGDAASLLRIERDACVVVALGAGMASECGDLRVVHALPSARVLNRVRTPVLTYNSDHARPHPVVAAHFAGPAGTTADSIEAVLLVNGSEVARQRWPGWSAAQTRRIAIAFDASGYVTGVYPYALQVTAKRAGGTRETLSATRTGRMIVVNRSGSPFGAGWWLSGVEQLVPIPGDSLLWVGGDGSARLYGRTPAGRWRAEAYDRPDSIYQPAGSTGYVRPLPGGARVHFSGDGYHVATESALRHLTRFRWHAAPSGQAAEMRLDTLVLPSPSGQADTLLYLFQYGTPQAGCTTSTTGLTLVRAPAPAGGYRDIRLCGDSQRRVLRIRDALPDTTSVAFGYSGSTRWINRRTDRRGVADTLGYLRVRFHSARTPQSPGVSPTTRVQAAQTLGMNGVSVSADSVHVVYDGPRTDLCDCAWWKVDRHGAPTSLRNAYGQVTTLRRTDARWPGVVTETVAPNGFTTTASYDPLGYPASTTAWNPYGDGRNATTTYRWNDTAAAPTQIVAPEGEVTLMEYDAMGRRIWEQVGPDSIRRVRYAYHPGTDAGAPGLPERITYPGGAADRFEYDARGNLSATVSPLNVRSEIESDRLGRVVRTRVPVRAGPFPEWQQDSTVYDSRDRVYETIATGPEMNEVPRQWLHVRSHYDEEGAVKEVWRWSNPDNADVDTLRTRWEYDLAGRPVVEIAADTTPGTWADNPRDSTFYDLAGNVVRVRTRRFAESLADDASNPAAAYIRMEYDALNRLTRRILPAVRYPARYEGMVAKPWSGMALKPYPYYPNHGLRDLRIPADTALFQYNEPLGLQDRATNANALVRRRFYPNGQLRYDSLYTQTVEGSDFDAHRYGLEYRYDRAGRATELLHPAQLRPPLAAAQGRTGSQFGYDRVTGALAVVTDPLGSVFRYHYNARGEPDSLVLPGGITHRYTYNAGGQLERHRILNASTSAFRYPGSLLRDESLEYDERGKLTAARNGAGLLDTLTVSYTGLGHLLSSTHQYRGFSLQTGQAASHKAVESPRHDALGNIVSLLRGGATQVYATGLLEASASRRDSTGGVFRYERQTGRLLQRQESRQYEFTQYDAAGNTVFTTAAPPGTLSGQLFDRASFYDGGGRLWAVDVRRVEDATARAAPQYVTFEEYRLDALGRRVLVRARKECFNAEGDERICSMSSVRRTVWAGDQELYEIQMPLDQAENDVGDVAGESRYDGGFDPNPFWGRVGYTFGGGIDRPLSIVRMGYTSNSISGLHRWNEFAVVPHWNAHGRAESGTFHDGAKDRCRATYQTWEEYRELCVQVEWTEGMFPYNPAPRAADHWHGTLLAEKRDASGLLYRRYRYYDPATGRFTQEDPIGLAGGVNAYGFAEGDPVTYSDPYGLCADDLKDKRGRCPGGWDDTRYRQIESYIQRLDPGAREGLMGMLEGGQIRRHGGALYYGREAGSPRERIVLASEFFNDKRDGYETADQRAFVLAHEYGHQLQRQQRSLLYLPMNGRSISAYFNAGRGTPLHNHWQNDANVYACRHSTNVARGNWQTDCNSLGVP